MASPSLQNPAQDPVESKDDMGSPKRIHQLARDLRHHIDASVCDAASINVKVRLLAMNARIEASHAGQAGRGFAVVAEEMATMAGETKEVFARLEKESQDRIAELVSISRDLGTTVRGTRLADLALTNVDLADRCLYERTCDVRWWATDQAVVEMLQAPSESSVAHCTRRLGVILKAYTVYFDIVVCDLQGRVLANGRPELHPTAGRECANEPWFRSAWETPDGDHFGFQTAHASEFVGGRSTLAYACKVCAQGDAKGTPLGVIAVFFNWADFSRRIIEATPIAASERADTRILLVDRSGTIVADSAEGTPLPLPRSEFTQLFEVPKTSHAIPLGERTSLLGFARSPGFETYATGWGSLIIQDLGEH